MTFRLQRKMEKNFNNQIKGRKGKINMQKKKNQKAHSKIDLSPNMSLIILNVNELNAPAKIKITKLAKNIKLNNMLFTNNTQKTGQRQFKCQRIEKEYLVS